MSLDHPVPPVDTSAAGERDRAHPRVRRVSAPVAAAVLLAAIAVALAAQFALDGLADEGDLWHWVQHGLLFWGGLATGASLVVLYRRGQRRV